MNLATRLKKLEERIQTKEKPRFFVCCKIDGVYIYKRGQADEQHYKTETELKESAGIKEQDRLFIFDVHSGAET